MLFHFLNGHNSQSWVRRRSFFQAPLSVQESTHLGPLLISSELDQKQSSQALNQHLNGMPVLQLNPQCHMPTPLLSVLNKASRILILKIQVMLCINSILSYGSQFHLESKQSLLWLLRTSATWNWSFSACLAPPTATHIFTMSPKPLGAFLPRHLCFLWFLHTVLLF